MSELPQQNQYSPAKSPSTKMERLRLELTHDEGKCLLANLSPEATLQALRSTKTVITANGKKAVFLQSSIEQASDQEREWGIQAAIAAMKIRNWLAELQAWPWEKSEKPTGVDFQAQWEDQQVNAYLERIDDIKEEMDTLEVKSLKDHIRQAMVRDFANNMDYENLEDFTAIITATLVRALPPLLHLESLLKAWSIRLRVLRYVPAFLRDLKGFQGFMKEAQTAVGSQLNDHIASRHDFTHMTFLDTKSGLEGSVQHLGRSIDEMLDHLEGTHDILPASWIDAVDQLESDYSSWVVQGEAVAAGNEIARSMNILDTDGSSGYFSQSTSEALAQTHGASDLRLAAPFEATYPINKHSSDLSNTSISSDGHSDVSRRSSVSSGRSSPEIMNALIATNPGSPVKVTTPVRQCFQNASIQRYGSVKNKDIRRLLVRRSDSCPSSIPLVEPDAMRRQSVGGTSLVSIQPEAEPPGSSTGAGQSQSKLSHDNSADPTPPRTPSPDKSKSRFEQFQDFAAGSAPITVAKQRRPNHATPKTPNLVNGSPKHGNKLHAKLSTIISDIGVDIRLKSSDARPAPPPTNPTRPKTPLHRSITPSLLRHTTPDHASVPSLTLAPASAPGPKGHDRSVNEPEIKLYHLQQTDNTGGKDATPVKLYVRLVGPEGERVMVRVGGGWADLAEYLKDYALHHGATSNGKKRAVSDFQIQNMPTPGTGSTGVGNRPTPKTAPSTRPGSRNGAGDVELEYDEYGPPSPSPALAPGTTMNGRVKGKKDKDKLTFGWLGKVGSSNRVFLKRRATLEGGS